MPHKFMILMLLLCISNACDKKRVFDQYVSFDSGWHKDRVITFNLPLLDSLERYNLYVNMRTTNAYPFQNLFLIGTVIFPHGKRVVDTLEYEMAEADGRWLGTGFTDLKENKLWYKEGVRFVEDGAYQVTLRHGMRKNGSKDGVLVLEGVSDLGFRIEKEEMH